MTIGPRSSRNCQITVIMSQSSDWILFTDQVFGHWQPLNLIFCNRLKATFSGYIVKDIILVNTLCNILKKQKNKTEKQRAHVFIGTLPKRQKNGVWQLMLLQVSTCFSEPQTFHKCTQGHLPSPFIYNNLNYNLHITGNKLQSIKSRFNRPNLTLNSMYKCSGVYLLGCISSSKECLKWQLFRAGTTKRQSMQLSADYFHMLWI